MTIPKLAACLLILLATYDCARSEDKKKHMIVHAGNGVRQVNNHPWSYTTPGQASTNCSTNGTVNATGTTMGDTTNINGTVNANTDCNTTYRPPQTTSGNRITVDNASWVTDTVSGDRYLIQCTAGWVGSKCSYLNDGDYKAALEGNNMWITGTKGMKEMTAKYHVLRYIQANRSASLPSASAQPIAQPVAVTSHDWTAEEKFTWDWYSGLSDDDKQYVRDFCSANPTERALLPHSKVLAGQPAERALYCAPWVSAKAKL
jgi:hypothetical protein